MHPEAYGLARRIVAACGRDLRAIMGDEARLKALDPRDFVDGTFGLPTVRDILAELAKPGGDPRPGFATANFAEGVDDIRDLKSGMLLEGTVTNVAAFGAFVDIGVHQDGLVHVSQLADRFVKEPHEVVKAGEVVKVRVVDVDIPRKRIGLSMRPQPTGESGASTGASVKPGGERRAAGKSTDQPPLSKEQATGAVGAALLNALKAR